MSMILQHGHRPWVVFDPANKNHRRYYADFIRYRTWGKCPVRFYLPEDAHRDLLLMIHDKLARYYTEREFGKIEVESSKRAA